MMYELMTLEERFWLWLGFALISPIGLALLPILVIVVWAVFRLPAWYPVFAIPGVMIGWMIIFLSITEVKD